MRWFIVSVLPALFCSVSALAQTQVTLDELAAAFEGAQRVDLRTSQVSSVAKLRDVVRIPPPSDPVLVKTFKRNELPAVLKPAFAKPGVCGVTIAGRYIAIIHTDLYKEHQDILRHELVHAYITLASPKPLPFWFQEASAVYFSTGKARKFYGQPSQDQVGVMIGKTVDLDPVYKQKLQSFRYLAEKSGEKKFYGWIRDAVVSGTVDARRLLDTPTEVARPRAEFRRPLPVLWIAIGVVVVVAVIVIGFYASRRDEEY
jgi:hypothetical protein